MNKSNSQTELIHSLASSIQHRIISPAEENVSLINRAMEQVNNRIANLEENAAILKVSLRRTRTIAIVSLLGVAALAAVQIYMLFM